MTELEAIAQVRSLKGTELLGTIYDFAIEVVTRDQALDPARMLAAPLTIELSVDGGETHRQIHGVAAQVTDHLTTESKTPIYRLRFVPRLWRLTLTQTTEIFMDMTVPEVIAAKLERAGFVQGTDFELRLRASYPAREYIVQYDETDLRFVQRLAEHVGITLFFEQDEDHERVVLADHDEAFGELAEGGVARFFPRGDERGVFELTSTTSTLPARYVVKDYNYRTPQVALLGEARAPDVGTGIVYEYGGHFKTPDEAEQLSRIRAEEAACRRVVFEGRADDVRLAPGARVKLDGHPLGEPELLITRVDHDYKDVTFLHGGTGDEHSYRSRFEAVSSEVPYRPARVTPKPRIHGCITAQIEAAHESPYAELDEEGRYHVRFLFDVGDAPRGKATRLVRMAQPHTGPGYGFHFPLRHGVEVLITFIDGDPDRPIISAAVPNPQTPSVVGSGNRTRNIIRTGAGNEINIDDTEGAERIKLYTPYGNSSFHLGAPNQPSSGAALQTSESWNAVAGSSVTTASTAVSIFSDVASCFASADIIDFAGATNPLKALLGKGPDIVKKAADLAEGTLDTAAKYEQAQIDQAKYEASKAREAAQKEQAAKARYEADGRKVPADVEQRLRSATDRANRRTTDANRLAGIKKLNDEERRAVRQVTAWGKTAADIASKAKAAKGAAKQHEDNKGFVETSGDKWTQASEISSKAAGSAAAGQARMNAGLGKGFASIPRIGGSVVAPGTPMNIQAAANGAALVGNVSATVSAMNAAVVGGAQAVMCAGGKALVKSPGQAEIAGTGRCLVTSAGLVDIKSDAVLKSASGASSVYSAGSSLSMKAAGTMRCVAGGVLIAQSKSSASVQAAAKLALKGKPVAITSGATMGLESSGAMAMKAGGSYDVKASGDATIKGPKVKCAGSGASLTVSGVADLKSNGNALIDAGGTATVKGASVNVKSGGAVNLSGSVIKAKGRCLLG